MAFKDKETELAYRRTYYFRNRDRLRKQKRAEYRRNYLKYAQRARRKLLSEEQREKVYIYNKNWIKKIKENFVFSVFIIIVMVKILVSVVEKVIQNFWQ